MIKTYLAEVAYDRKRGWPHCFIWPILYLFSLLYLLGLSLVRTAYLKGWLKVCRPKSTVISIGNITLGGTGKTPLVIMLSHYLRQTGFKAAVLIRGYGPGKIADEVRVLEKNLSGIPVLTGADRITNAAKAQTEHGADTIILDDGFQHWKLARDLDIVCLDSLNPFGNGYLLPRGILREPISALKRADIIVITGSGQSEDIAKDLNSRIKDINPEALIVQAQRTPIYLTGLQDEERLELELIKDKPISLFCGIGNPDNFKKTLTSLGARLKAEFIFPDHHLYTPADLEQIITVSQEKGIEKIITTQKDAVRLDRPENNNNILVLHIEMRIKLEQQKEFEYRLSRLYNS